MERVISAHGREDVVQHQGWEAFSIVHLAIVPWKHVNRKTNRHSYSHRSCCIVDR